MGARQASIPTRGVGESALLLHACPLGLTFDRLWVVGEASMRKQTLYSSSSRSGRTGSRSTPGAAAPDPDPGGASPAPAADAA